MLVLYLVLDKTYIYATILFVLRENRLDVYVCSSDLIAPASRLLVETSA